MQQERPLSVQSLNVLILASFFTFPSSSSLPSTNEKYFPPVPSINHKYFPIRCSINWKHFVVPLEFLSSLYQSETTLSFDYQTKTFPSYPLYQLKTFPTSLYQSEIFLSSWQQAGYKLSCNEDESLC